VGYSKWRRWEDELRLVGGNVVNSPPRKR
jgi:hypothetical protein